MAEIHHDANANHNCNLQAKTTTSTNLSERVNSSSSSRVGRRRLISISAFAIFLCFDVIGCTLGSERSLTSIEIDGNAALVDLVAETRAAAGFGDDNDYGNDDNNDYDDNNNDNDEELLYSSSCDPVVYYKPIQSNPISRDEWQKLLEASHRRTLPYTNKNSDDVWKALKDLDRGSSTSDGSSSSSVRLIYSNKDVPAEPKGTPATWNREHVWPKSLGVGYSGSDFTDVHHLFPADWGINSIRSNRYFDRCADESVCRPPSELEGSEDAPFFGGDVFQPPSVVRGDVARAIFYMDLRYTHLEVTDCPDANSTNKNQMAYLSTLLEWHQLDPPTEAERVRNDRACSRWQGNRNPFVDYPDLVKTMYGTPAATPADRLSRCSSNVDGNVYGNVYGNVEEPPVVDIKLPAPGDVMIAGVHSDNPDLVALVTLEDLPSGLVIHMTDNAYDGNSFASNEGTLSLTLPKTMKAGTVFGYGEGLLYGSSWSSEMDKGFALSASGDTVIVYCTTNDYAKEANEYNFLSAFSFTGAFKAAEEEYAYYGTSSSALPVSIADFSVAVEHLDNYVYTGQTTGIKASLQEHLVDKRNWEGFNSKPLTAKLDGFIIIDETRPGI